MSQKTYTRREIAKAFAERGFNGVTSLKAATQVIESLQAQRNQLLDQLKAANADIDRLNWLDENAPFELHIKHEESEAVQIRRWHRRYISYHAWRGASVRDAIDEARKREIPF